eukprot:2410811-Rhodomonas_salina.1
MQAAVQCACASHRTSHHTSPRPLLRALHARSAVTLRTASCLAQPDMATRNDARISRCSTVANTDARQPEPSLAERACKKSEPIQPRTSGLRGPKEIAWT